MLDQRARRFLYRMTVLRRPAEWILLGLLGEEDEAEETVFATAARLRDTSLLEQMELFANLGDGKTDMVTRYALHPATAQFIIEAHPADRDLLLATHRCLGKYLEAEAKTSTDLAIVIEAGHHLFEADAFERAFYSLDLPPSGLRIVAVFAKVKNYLSGSLANRSRKK